MPSSYQGDLFRALVASGEVDLRVIFGRHLDDDRRRLGWEEDVSGFPHRFLERQNQVIKSILVARGERNRLHIVNGIWAEPAFAAALVTLAMHGAKYFVYSEAPDPFLARPTYKTAFRQAFGRAIVRRTAGALPVSHAAADYCLDLGLPEQVLYPFGYFCDVHGTYEVRPSANKGSRTEVLFVGQLIRRKGVDLLLDSMLPLLREHPELVLTYLGSGEMEGELSSGIEAMGLSDRVSFEGATPSEKIRARMAAADVLVLPSRWDGWGVVVNEALSTGVPVVVSDRCGAAELIRNGVNGYVFRSESVTDLRACLQTFINSRLEWPSLRAAALKTAESSSATRAAAYLIDCLKHATGARETRPSPPWTQAAALVGP